MTRILVKLLTVVAFAIQFISCGDRSKAIEHNAIATIDTVIDEDLIPNSFSQSLPDSSALEKDSVFDYKVRAFDNIYFGAHGIDKSKSIELLNRYFKISPHEHYYYGLYKFLLMTEIESLEETKDILNDMSLLISKKYSNSKTINKYVRERSALLRLHLKVALSPEKFDENIIPKDEGVRFIYRIWENNQTEIELGYRIAYTWSEEEVEEKPKQIKFSRVFKPYLEYEDSYLRNLIDEGIEMEYKSAHEKMLKESESKF